MDDPALFMPHLEFTQNLGLTRFEPLKKQVEAFQVILNSEHIRENFSVRVYDVAVVLVLGNINADVDHGATLRLCI